MTAWTKARAVLRKRKEYLRRIFRDRYKYTRTEGHSKGPWDLKPDGQGSFYECSSLGLRFEVGVRSGMRRSKDDERWHRNALLIEAAPVLYAELKNLVEKLEYARGVSISEDLHFAKLALELAKADVEVRFELEK